MDPKDAEHYSAFRVAAWQVCGKGNEQKDDSGCKRGLVDMTRTWHNTIIDQRITDAMKEDSTLTDAVAAEKVWGEIFDGAREECAALCRSKMVRCSSILEHLPEEDI
jgi:hypothetical protein